jgi:hypothetical protein
MNGINLDPVLRQTLAQQEYERLRAEANKARLIKRVSLENAGPKEDRGLSLVSSIKSVRERISDTGASILIALRAKEDTASA